MAGVRYRVAGSDVYRYPGDPVIVLDDVLSPSPLLYVLSTFISLIISITRLFSSHLNPLYSLVITTRAKMSLSSDN